MDHRSFNPVGATIKVVAAASAPAGGQASASPQFNQYRIANAGTVGVHYAFGTDATDAQNRAVIPTGVGANAKHSYFLPPNAVEVISAPPNAFWSAITASGTADVFITPGRGL